MQNTSDGLLKAPACIMLLIGAMIGSAIFSLSGLTIFLAGPAAVASWLIGGLIMLLYGLFMAELACRYPESGGVYYFPRLAFPGRAGQWLGWFSCWSFILTNVVAIAFSAIYVGQYLSVAFPWAAGWQLPLALGAILFCLVLNLIRVDLAGRINALIVLALLAAIAVYLGTAFFGGSYEPGMLTPFFSQGAAGTFGMLSTVPIAIIGYSGIVALAFMVSQVHEARRTIPFAMLVSIVIVALLYALLILSTTGLVSAAYLKEHPDMQFIPMFCACFTKLNSWPWLTAVVSIAAVLALMTTMLVCVSMNAYAIRAAGNDGLLPRILGSVSRNGVPAAGAMLTCAAAMILSCFPESTQQIVNFGAVFNALTMVLTMLALIRSRRAPEPCDFTAPGGKVLPYVVLIILLACDLGGVVSGDVRMWVYTAVMIAVGVVIMLVPKKIFR